MVCVKFVKYCWCFNVWCLTVMFMDLWFSKMNEHFEQGTLQSDQGTVQAVTALGNQLISTSRGSGQGTNVTLTGAVQSGGQASRRRAGVAIPLEGTDSTDTNQVNTSDQAAATGDATADSGAVQSDQTINQQNNANNGGSMVSSSSRGSGQGTGIHVSGAAQATGQGLVSQVCE